MSAISGNENKLGVTAPAGFKAAGVHCGIKKMKPDLALLWSDARAAAAGVFTQNVVKAAAVQATMQRIAAGYARMVVINSGNANSCTGERGLADAETMAETAAEALGVSSPEVLVASTGVIGVPLPMDDVTKGIITAAGQLNHQGGESAAEAIITTDTFPKQAAARFTQGGKTVTVGGMAKGSGMICPNMATMLSFITTDAEVDPETLQKALKYAADRSFNRITVDGDASTNDMVLLLANGAAGAPVIDSEGEAFFAFREALTSVCTDLAKAIVRDGEGATKFIQIEVRHHVSAAEAKQIAMAVANSNLFKTAMFGEDANWGRILVAAGCSGVKFDPERMDISLASAAGEIKVAEQGMGLAFDEAAAAEILHRKDIGVIIDMGRGQEEAVVWTCDLSYEYVRINGEYRT